MPWTNDWLRHRPPPISERLQLLVGQLQAFLESVWDGNPSGFLSKVTEELAQLKLQLKHKKIECVWATKAMSEINLLTKTYGEELRRRPHELESGLVGRILQQVQAMERLSVAVETIAATLQTDLQMCEDVDSLHKW